MPVLNPPEYYNRFDVAKKYDEHLFVAGKVLQSAELNEIQAEQHSRLRSVADAVFRDGDIIRDCQLVIDRDAGAVYCQSGAVYLMGAVRGVPDATLTVPMVGHVQIGINVIDTVVTSVEDPELRDPAASTRNYQRPGAARLKREPRWALGGDNFFPIWDLDDGFLRPRGVPPGLSAMDLALEKYDRDSAGGHYVVSGLRIRQELDTADGKQVYTITQGEARVAGKAITLQASRRLVFDASPDLKWIDSEPHMSDNAVSQAILFDRWPIAGEPQIRITTRRTVTITHGGFTGVADPLPDDSVIVIESVVQGGTSYNSGTDWTLVAGQIDWSPGGAEPSPGSTYDITYQYIKSAAPLDLTDRGCRVEGALSGTLTLVSYNQALRRIDRLCLGSDGVFSWVQGASSQWIPRAPRVPPGRLALASIYQYWDDRRKVVEDSVRMVPMDVLSNYQNELNTLREDQAEIRLAVDVSGRYSGIKKGLFADPFISNDQRDAGVDQDCIVNGGKLTLPFDFDVLQLPVNNHLFSPHLHVPILTQPAITGSMKVNPYMSFAVAPANLDLVPSVDRWVESTTKWAPSVVVSGFGGSYTQTLNSTSIALNKLRPIDVNFTAHPFGPGESVSSVVFDGITVTPSPAPVANNDGVVAGVFSIPDNVTAGTKLVEVTGSGGSFAIANYTGDITLIEKTIRAVTVVNNVDPLSQTFMLNSPRQISGVDLWFTAVGDTTITIMLRTVSNGVPTREVIVSCDINPIGLTTGAYTRIEWAPVTLEQDTEYAISVMCNDSVTEVGIAEIGKFDTVGGVWVTSQPYQVGVLLSSSNNSTWTAHQDKDIAFKLLQPSYLTAEHVEYLGTVSVSDTTDLVINGAASLPSTDCDFRFRVAVGSDAPLDVAPGQVIRLPTRFTGSVAVSAVFIGSENLAPVLDPGVQVVAGSIHTSGTYITPMIAADAGATSDLRVVLEANLPSGATIGVHSSTEEVPSAWTPVPIDHTSPFSAGVIEFTYQGGLSAAEKVRFRITLGGSHLARPEAMNLRAVVL